MLLGAPGERVGSAEQYASAFALLARAKGYPARVAVGYRLRPEQRQGDRYTVSTTDAHAWPEVHLAGFGWVPFEPTDAAALRGAAPAADPRGDARRGRPRPAGRRPRAGSSRPAPTLAEVALRVVRGLAVAAGVLLGLAVLVAAAKAVRRRRRARRGPPVRRVLAAWAEVVDLLRETGLAVPVSRTSSEVAADVRHSAAAVAARVGRRAGAAGHRGGVRPGAAGGGRRGPGVGAGGPDPPGDHRRARARRAAARARPTRARCSPPRGGHAGRGGPGRRAGPVPAGAPAGAATGSVSRMKGRAAPPDGGGWSSGAG